MNSYQHYMESLKNIRHRYIPLLTKGQFTWHVTVTLDNKIHRMENLSEEMAMEAIKKFITIKNAEVVLLREQIKKSFYEIIPYTERYDEIFLSEPDYNMEYGEDFLIRYDNTYHWEWDEYLYDAGEILVAKNNEYRPTRIIRVDRNTADILNNLNKYYHLISRDEFLVLKKKEEEREKEDNWI